MSTKRFKLTVKYSQYSLLLNNEHKHGEVPKAFGNLIGNRLNAWSLKTIKALHQNF